MHDDSTKAERFAFLTMALVSEGVLLLIAVAAGWLLGHPATANLKFSVEAIGRGLIATIPLLLLMAFIDRSRIVRLVQFRELIQRLLGKPLAACGWIDLVVVALSAGVCEEFLFRGVLEPWLCSWGSIYGIVVCNLLFGLCHSITPTYFVFATVMGVYLSMTLRWSDEPNLIIPICCHAFYDFVAFVIVRRTHLGKRLRNPSNEDNSDSAENSVICPDFPLDQ